MTQHGRAGDSKVRDTGRDAGQLTGLVLDPAGNLYAGDFTHFPSPAGRASVVDTATRGAARWFDYHPAASTAVLLANPRADGEHTGLTLGSDDALYITAQGTTAGEEQVLRCSLATVPEPSVAVLVPAAAVAVLPGRRRWTSAWSWYRRRGGGGTFPPTIATRSSTGGPGSEDASGCNPAEWTDGHVAAMHNANMLAPMSTPMGHPDSAEPSDVADGVVDGLFAARHSDAFAAGYKRAVNDLLADMFLLGEEFARDVPGHDETAATVRQAVRRFVRQFERHAEGRCGAPPAPGSASGDADLADGLGI